jgi:hypothetical protein
MQKVKGKENVNGVLRNRFYFAVALAKPIAGFSGNNNYGFFNGSVTGRAWGFSGDPGALLYFHKLPLNENIRLGVDLCFADFGYQGSNFSSPLMKLGGRFGPNATLKVSRIILIDFSFTLCPVVWFESPSYSTYHYLDTEFRIRRNFNFQIRLNKFLMGFQFDFGQRSSYFNQFSVNNLKIKTGFAF